MQYSEKHAPTPPSLEQMAFNVQPLNINRDEIDYDALYNRRTAVKLISDTDPAALQHACQQATIAHREARQKTTATASAEWDVRQDLDITTYSITDPPAEFAYQINHMVHELGTPRRRITERVGVALGMVTFAAGTTLGLFASSPSEAPQPTGIERVISEHPNIFRGVATGASVIAGLGIIGAANTIAERRAPVYAQKAAQKQLAAL